MRCGFAVAQRMMNEMNKKKGKVGHEEREHAPLPPSASGRWLECAPSQSYIKSLIAAGTIKKRASGPSAQRGTRIHEIAEPWLTALLKDEKVPKPPRGSDPEEVAEAKAYVDYCLERYLDAVALDKDVRWGVESEKGSFVNDDNWGSVDFWLLAGGRLTTVDLKSGREPVQARGNTQLLNYLLGIVRKRSLEPREFEAVVWQPNADDGLPPERSHVYTRKEFVAWVVDFINKMTDAQSWLRQKSGFEEKLVAGEWCKYCDALGVCPTARRKSLEISSRNFMPVPVIHTTLPEPSMLEEVQVSEILRRAPMFSSWIDAVRVRALELASRGKAVPGFKVVQKQTRRAWEQRYTDAQVAKCLGVPVKDIMETRRLSPAKVEDKLDAARKERLKGLVFKPMGDPTVVPDSDRRTPLLATKINFTPITREVDDDG